MNETVSLEEVSHVAALANLQLTDQEMPRMAHDLNAVLEYIAQLSQVETTGVEPMSQVAEMLGNEPEGNGAALRQDVVRPSVDRAAVMKEAPESDGRFYKVPKVMER